MIIITTIDGVLRIQAEVPIPSAPAGQWSPARIAKLLKLIEDIVDVAEMVDMGVPAIEIADCLAAQVRRGPVKPVKRRDLMLVGGPK